MFWKSLKMASIVSPFWGASFGSFALISPGLTSGLTGYCSMLSMNSAIQSTIWCPCFLNCSVSIVCISVSCFACLLADIIKFLVSFICYAHFQATKCVLLENSNQQVHQTTRCDVRMAKLSSEQEAEYFGRSYKAVDGLWFMKTEEKYGFNSALDVDNQVWSVMPKIQARMIKQFLGLCDGLDSLFESLVTKLELEGFKFTTEWTAKGFRIVIEDCPWYNLMIKSGREHLAEKVGKAICNTENRVWVSEFSDNIKFEFLSQKCCDSTHCTLDFTVH
jgi:hypothetical protein